METKYSKPQDWLQELHSQGTGQHGLCIERKKRTHTKPGEGEERKKDMAELTLTFSSGKKKNAKKDSAKPNLHESFNPGKGDVINANTLWERPTQPKEKMK